MNSSEHPFFSIVVPCCNVARYLDELVASVKGQSFADWECVLSYEDSTDSTLAACEALAAADPRFRVVKGPRSGSPATPRNRGLAVAKGRYVVWLDGDDYLADAAVLGDVAKALASAGESCDLVCGATSEFLEYDHGGRAPVGRHFNFAADDDGKVLSGHDVLVRFASLDYAWPMASLSVCRADFLRAEDLSFRDGLKHEDEEWTPRAVTRARRVLVMDRDFYHYRRRAGSVTTNTNAEVRARHFAEVVRSQLLFFAAQSLPPPVAAAVARYYLSRFLEYYFLPSKESGAGDVSAAAKARGLARILEKGGRAALWKVASRASRAKRLGAALLMLAGFNRVFDLPARLYFGLYYRLVLRRVRKAAVGSW